MLMLLLSKDEAFYILISPCIFFLLLFGPLFWTIQSNLSTFNSSTIFRRVLKQLLL